MDTRSAFIGLMERIAPQQGMTPIAGKILAILIHDGSELSFSDLATELQVSRGSISTNTRMLAACHMIERVRKPGERQDFFRVTRDLHVGLLGEMVRSLSQTAVAIRDLCQSMPAAHSDARARVEGYAAFYADIADALGHVVGRGPLPETSGVTDPHTGVRGSDANSLDEPGRERK